MRTCKRVRPTFTTDTKTVPSRWHWKQDNASELECPWTWKIPSYTTHWTLHFVQNCRRIVPIPTYRLWFLTGVMTTPVIDEESRRRTFTESWSWNFVDDTIHTTTRHEIDDHNQTHTKKSNSWLCWKTSTFDTDDDDVRHHVSYKNFLRYPWSQYRDIGAIESDTSGNLVEDWKQEHISSQKVKYSRKSRSHSLHPSLEQRGTSFSSFFKFLATSINLSNLDRFPKWRPILKQEFVISWSIVKKKSSCLPLRTKNQSQDFPILGFVFSSSPSIPMIGICPRTFLKAKFLRMCISIEKDVSLICLYGVAWTEEQH